MKSHSLKAQKREITGRKVKRLRSEGLIPANVFGKDVKSYAVSVSADGFRQVFAEAGETGIVELEVDKKKNPVLVSNVQKHPVTEDILHVDFRQVDLTKKITATVPVEVVGESPAEKSGLGTVVQQLSEVDVEALPTDLPESFEVDVTELTEVDQAIYVKDLKHNKSKVTIDADPELIIVKVEPPQKEEEVAPAPVEGEEAAEGEEAPEGEAPAEGGEAPAESGEEAPKEE